jgi:hypothetical protein
MMSGFVEMGLPRPEQAPDRQDAEARSGVDLGLCSRVCGPRTPTGLRWLHVDVEAGLIRSPPAERSHESFGHRACSGGKTRFVENRSGDIILMPQREARLQQHRETAFASGFAEADDCVLCTTFGTPTYDRNLSQRGLEVAATDAGINQAATRSWDARSPPHVRVLPDSGPWVRPDTGRRATRSR